jgi:3'(2'), 5'-bisphosphate nucleotidase
MLEVHTPDVGFCSPVAVIESGAASCPARFALRAARVGAVICSRAAGAVVHVENKTDGSPVTAVDYAVQARVGSLLNVAFPLDVLIGEESLRAFDALPESQKIQAARLAGMDLGSMRSALGQEACCLRSALDWRDERGRTWTLDPCDGTKGLVSRQSYAVGVARSAATPTLSPDVAALALPLRQVILVAMDEELTIYSLAGHPASLPECPTNPTGSEKRWHFSPASDPIVLRNLPPPAPLCCGSLVKYGEVALGCSEALVQALPSREAHIWDHAAGITAVIAAGGRVTDLRGAPVLFAADNSEHPLATLTVRAPGIVATAKGVDHERYCALAREAIL